jgi:hypothetical protein
MEVLQYQYLPIDLIPAITDVRKFVAKATVKFFNFAPAKTKFFPKNLTAELSAETIAVRFAQP